MKMNSAAVGAIVDDDRLREAGDGVVPVTGFVSGVQQGDSFSPSGSISVRSSLL